MKFSVFLVYFLLGEGDSPPHTPSCASVVIILKKIKNFVLPVGGIVYGMGLHRTDQGMDRVRQKMF